MIPLFSFAYLYGLQRRRVRIMTDHRRRMELREDEDDEDDPRYHQPRRHYVHVGNEMELDDQVTFEFEHRPLLIVS
jgi:hypothetical protein